MGAHEKWFGPKKSGGKRVSKATAGLLGYKNVKDVPFGVSGPHGAPTNPRQTEAIRKRDAERDRKRNAR